MSLLFEFILLTSQFTGHQIPLSLSLLLPSLTRPKILHVEKTVTHSLLNVIINYQSTFVNE